MIWKHIEIGGKRAAFCDSGKGRLYVCERPGAVAAWVRGAFVGHFASVDDAKAEAARRAAGHPPAPPKPRPEFKRVVRAEPVVEPLRVPDVFKDITPPPIKEAAAPLGPPVFRPANAFPISSLCKCGAKLGRSGKCPALCEPVTGEPPVYDGPRFVGKTHTARLGAPVTW
ncbi:hypothetical protein [Bradyrhizobium erythrophlei]|uniref:Uncharacterized protein n=1 Tax=Bradyrhizobium erythrophlei TaxID=1437360 RepID=A0A1M5NLU7_9BRAD|nr:hypothetical protein [Bradyrhizobium erythrophlei]SHG90511.1 hypothetical protein SAMN05443248_3045 [Bradyrhizobium erythrophlei]